MGCEERERQRERESQRERDGLGGRLREHVSNTLATH